MALTTYYGIAFVVTVAVSLTLAAVAWRRRSVPGSTYFALMMLSGAWWAFSYAMVELSKEPSLWLQLSTLGDCTMPVFFMLFALSYWRPDIRIRLQYQILIWLIPVATIVIDLTNRWHGFLWSEIPPSVGNASFLIFEHGQWFYVTMIYDFLTMWVGVVFLFRAATSFSKIYRRQALIVLVAAVIPLIANALFLFGLSPVRGLNIAPIMASVTGLLLAFGIVKFQLFKVLPIAKEVVYRQMENGVLVVNSQGIVVDVNPAAGNMLGGDVEVGQKVEAVLKDRLGLSYPLPSVHQRTEASLNEREQPPLWLDVVIAPLYDRHSQLSGHLIMLHDISDRKSVEELLRHSEERYRLLAENATDLIWTSNINMKLTYISPSVRRILGYTVEEAMVLPMGKVYTPASAKAVIEVLKDEMEKEQIGLADPKRSRMVEVELYRKDESIVPIEINFSIVHDAAGKNVGTLAIARDITERKRTEEAQHRLAVIVESSRDAILSRTLDGIITTWNKGAEMLYGYTTEEIIGQNVSILVPPEFADELQQFQDKLKHGEAVKDYEAVRLSKNGVRIDVLLTVSPIQDMSGRIVGASAIAQDITERKKVEEALRESEIKYRSLTEKMNDIVWIMGLDLRITYVSPSVFKALGFTPEEHMKRQIQDQLTPESLQTVIQTWTNELGQDEKEGLDPNRTAALELEYYRKDGSTVWMENVVSAIRDDHGKPVGLHGVSRDITERKRVEEVLKESEKKYRELFENANEAIFVAQDAKIVFTNPMLMRMFGYSEEELSSKLFIEFIYPDDRDMVIDRHRRRLAGEELPPVYAFRVVRRDGNVRWVELSAVVIEWVGKPATLNFLSDITERRQADERVKQVAEEWQTTFDSISDMVSIQDRDYRIIRLNKAYADAVGMKIEDIVGQHCHEVIHNKSSHILNCPHHRTLETKKAMSQEIFEPRLGAYLEVSTSPIFDKAGEVIGSVHIAKDISERRRAEENLKVSEKKYRTLFDDSIDAVLISTIDGKILDCNDAMLTLTGYERDELINLNAEKLYANPADREKFVREIQKTGAVKEYGVRWRRKGGTEVDVVMTLTARWDDSGSVAGFQGIIRDVTERKKIEQMKTDFVSFISHQLRTPTAGLMGYIDNMLDGITGELNNKQVDYLSEMRDVCARNNRLIADLLNISRLERGVLVANIGPVALRDTVNIAVKEYRKSIEEKGLTLNISEAEQGVVVLADSDKLVEVLKNVIHNASKFTKEGSIDIEISSRGKVGIVKIRDSGVGMTEAVVKDLFKKEKVFGGAVSVGGGAGLGLYIAKGFMKLQGGDIMVESTVGKGSTFTISLPLQ